MRLNNALSFGTDEDFRANFNVMYARTSTSVLCALKIWLFQFTSDFNYNMMYGWSLFSMFALIAIVGSLIIKISADRLINGELIALIRKD